MNTSVGPKRNGVIYSGLMRVKLFYLGLVVIGVKMSGDLQVRIQATIQYEDIKTWQHKNNGIRMFFIPWHWAGIVYQGWFMV